MGNLAHPLAFTDLSSRKDQYIDLQAAAYTRETMLSSREANETSLTLQTMEGDLVTLNSSSFSSKNAFTYDRTGAVATENGQLTFSHQHQEITLASGQNFSFSVEGNLSEQELDDIEELLQGLDAIMASMRHGEMEDVLEQSLSLSTYDTVSSFSADLSYARRVEVQSSYSAVAAQGISGEEVPVNSKDSRQVQPSISGNGKNKKAHPHHLFKLMHDLLQRQNDKTASQAQNPITKLFQHHMKESNDNDKQQGMAQTLQNVQEEVNAMITDMVNKIVSQEPVNSTS